MTLIIGGTTEILSQPNLEILKIIKTLSNLLMKKISLFMFLNSLAQEDDDITVSIGSENLDEKLLNYQCCMQNLFNR